MSALIHIREKLMSRKHNVIVFNALRTLFTLSSYLAIPKVYGLFLDHETSCFVIRTIILARIMDLQICSWLRQDPMDYDRISTWIETHQSVIKFDSKI